MNIFTKHHEERCQTNKGSSDRGAGNDESAGVGSRHGKGASKFAVCEQNWPKDAPYAPDCNGSIARTSSHLAVMFHVRGLDLRATVMEDNGHSWEDSCCEFFVTDPYDGTYYNFELTCIGSLLAAKRTSRVNKTMLSPSLLASVKGTARSTEKR